jgi:glutamate-1-semialdehyde 2,1-aminomutase
MDSLTQEAGADLTHAAARVLPGGGFGNMDPDCIIRSGRGGRIWDVNGHEYVD